MTVSIGVRSGLALGEQFRKYRRLQDAEPDVETDADQHEAEAGRGMLPAPGQELLAGRLTEGQHREIGQEQSARHPELRPGCDEPTRLVGASPFHRHQHRAAPLPANADALDGSKDGQDHRAPDADAPR